MLPDRVSNPGPLTYESGALPIVLCGPAEESEESQLFVQLGGTVLSFYVCALLFPRVQDKLSNAMHKGTSAHVSTKEILICVYIREV